MQHCKLHHYPSQRTKYISIGNYNVHIAVARNICMHVLCQTYKIVMHECRSPLAFCFLVLDGFSSSSSSSSEESSSDELSSSSSLAFLVSICKKTKKICEFSNHKLVLSNGCMVQGGHHKKSALDILHPFLKINFNFRVIAYLFLGI